MIRHLLWLNRRIRLLAAFIAVFGIGLGLYTIAKTAPYGMIKLIVEGEMSKIFKQRITIEAMSGNLISQATFKGIRFYNNPKFGKPGVVLYIPQATAHYNLLKVLAHNGDFGAGTHTLTVKSVEISAHRNTNDLWNILMVLPPPEPGAPPLSFTGRIYFEDMVIRYQDDKGWGKRPLQDPFRVAIHTMQGLADFKDIRNARLVWSGQLGITNAPITVVGNLNTTNGQWVFQVDATDVPLGKWGSYVMTTPGFQLDGERVNVAATLSSKYLSPPTEFPFNYTAAFVIQKGRFKLPTFPVPLTDINGRLTLRSVGKQGMKMDVSLPAASVGDSTLSIDGSLNLDQSIMALTLRSDACSVATIKALFPSMKNWKINGVGNAIATVTGRFDAPIVTGNFTVPTLTAYGFPIEAVLARFDYQNQRLTLETTQATLHDGPLEMHATLNTAEAVPQLTARLRSQNLDTHRIGTGPVSGRISTDIMVTGPTAQLALSIVAESPNGLKWMNQRIDAVQISGNILNGESVVIDRAAFWINRGPSPLIAYGLIKNWDHAEFAFSGSGLLIADPSELGPQLGNGSVRGHLTAALTPEFWENPRQTIALTATGTLAGYPVLGHVFDAIVFDVSMSPSGYAIRQFVGRSNTQTLAISGEFIGTVPAYLDLKAEGFVVALDDPIQRYIPTQLKPFSGALTGSALFKRRPDSTGKNWINQFTATGNLTLTDVLIRGQQLNSLRWAGNWTGTVLNTDQALIQHQKSLIGLSGSISELGDIALIIRDGTRISFDDFDTTLRPYVGRLLGEGSVSGSINGRWDAPDIMVFTQFTNIEWGKVVLPSVSGGFGYDGKKIVAKSINIKPKEGLYQLNGYVNLDSFDTNSSQPKDFDIELNVQPTSLAGLSALIESIRYEWLLRYQSDRPVPVQRTKNENITQSQANPFERSDTGFKQSTPTLYSAGQPLHSLAILEQAQLQHRDATYIGEIGLSTLLSGEFYGRIRAQSRPDQVPNINGQLVFKNATLGFLRGEMIRLDVATAANALNYTLDIQRGDMGGSPFDRLLSTGTYAADGYLTINQSEVAAGNGQIHSVLTGRFPLSAYWNDDDESNPIDIRLTWDKDDVNILTVFSPYVKRVTNKGQIILRVTGPVSAPNLATEKVVLKDAAILLNDELVPIQSPLRIVNGGFEIQNNTLSLNGLTFDWRGPDTMRLGSSVPETNRLVLNGSIAIQQLQLVRPTAVKLGMDVQLPATTLSINFAQLYRGQIRLEPLRIKGTYVIPISTEEKARHEALQGTIEETGPVISGTATLFDGELVLPSLAEKKIRPSFVYDFKGFIDQNVRLVGSLVGDGLLADVANRFDLSLAQTTQPLIITGTLNAPRIQNAITVSTGFVNILNRQFEILSIDRQRDYYRSNQYKLHNNTVGFQTDFSSTKNKLIPILNITALTVIDPLQTATGNAAATDAQKYSHVLVTMQGSVYNLGGLQFERFVSERSDTGGTFEFRGTYGIGGSTTQSNDSSDLAKILAPELLQTTPESGGNTVFFRQVGSGAVTYISQVALRGIERNLAKNIGVDDIQINYKLGEALFGTAASNQTVGVSVGKSLFSNQLYVRAKTDVDVDRRKTNSPLQLSEIELTYYLERYWSLNYANFVDDAGIYRNRYNVKYSYEF